MKVWLVNRFFLYEGSVMHDLVDVASDPEIGKKIAEEDAGKSLDWKEDLFFDDWDAEDYSGGDEYSLRGYEVVTELED